MAWNFDEALKRILDAEQDQNLVAMEPGPSSSAIERIVEALGDALLYADRKHGRLAQTVESLYRENGRLVRAYDQAIRELKKAADEIWMKGVAIGTIGKVPEEAK